MSIIKLIALLGILICCVTFIAETVRKKKHANGLFAMLFASSVGLLVVSSYVEKRMPNDAMAANSAVDASTKSAQETDTAVKPEQVAAVHAQENSDDDGFALGEPIQDTPDAQNANAENNDNRNDADNNAEAPTNDNAEAPVAKNDEAQANENNEAPAADNNEAPAAENNNDSPEAPVADNKPEEKDDAQPEPAPAANDPNAPVAEAGNDLEEIKVGEPVVFSGKKSKAAKGTSIASYHWDFGDDNSADGREVKHTYDKAGDYIATLTVIDKAGRIGTAARIIHVDRPANKVHFVNQKLPDAVDVYSTMPALSGTATKTYTGSKMTIEVSAFMAASGDGRCSLVASIHGPDCNVVKTKSEQEFEGSVTLKATCKGELGEYNWSVERKDYNNSCTWQKVVVSGFEN